MRRELRHTELMYGVRCLVYKTAVEKQVRVDIFGLIILMSICDKYGVFFFIELPRNKVQIFALLHNTRTT